MEKNFKILWITHNTVMLADEQGRTFTISPPDLLVILKNAPLKATKQRIHYKLEAE